MDNLHYTTYPTYLAEAAADWYNEVKSYEYSSASSCDGGVILHFTLMVWKSNAKIGCGVAECSPLLDSETAPGHVTADKATYTVCQYGPVPGPNIMSNAGANVLDPASCGKGGAAHAAANRTAAAANR